MNKAELIKKYMEQHTGNITKAQAERDVNTILGAMTDAIVNTDEGVSITGVFTIKRVWKNESQTSNPSKPGEKITVPAHYAVKFQAGAPLKRKLNPDAE